MTEPDNRSTFPKYAWLDGSLVPWAECVIHARSQGGLWGANVFEGVRAYWLPHEKRFNLFRIHDHVQRLRRSISFMRMDFPYTDAELLEAFALMLRANEVYEDVHMVAVAYLASDSIVRTNRAGLHLTSLRMPRHPTCLTGATARTSSWRRISEEDMPPRVKVGANYHNSRLAQEEALLDGYDTALLLNTRGTVAEGPAACLVMIKDGHLVTPPGIAGVLEGITLETVSALAKETLGLDTVRREIDRSELYAADELLLCGTLVELQPVISVDHHAIGDGTPGPTTRALQSIYDAAVRAPGSETTWITHVAPSS